MDRDPRPHLRGARLLIAIDTNLLVYAHREDNPFFARASTILRDLSEGSSPWAIPWPCLHEFLAVVTHPRIYAPPTPLVAALDQVDAWLESPSLVLLSEGPRFWVSQKPVLEAALPSGALFHDAKVAGICRFHEVRELWTADRDFGRFPGLVTRNPLVG